MANTVHTQSPHNVFERRSSTANGLTTLRRVRQDKPLPTSAPPSHTTASPSQKMTRGAVNGHKNQSFTKMYQNHAITRPKEKLYIWVDTDVKTQLKRIAQSKGLSVSQTGRAMIVDCIRQELRIEREVLATPILEAFFDKKMNQMINRLAEFLGRSVYEGGQLRWLVINQMYREVLNPDKKLTKEAFYKLLDTSQKETVKAVKQWNPNIKDVVAAIKNQLKEGEDT